MAFAVELGGAKAFRANGVRYIHKIQSVSPCPLLEALQETAHRKNPLLRLPCEEDKKQP
nr:hypothetical protein [Streptococcus sp. NLN76]